VGCQEETSTMFVSCGYCAIEGTYYSSSACAVVNVVVVVVVVVEDVTGHVTVNFDFVVSRDLTKG
jgi:hypothetical protein